MTDAPRPYASSPCMAPELENSDPAQQIAKWRKAERQRLLSLRNAMSVDDRQHYSRALAGHIRDLLHERFDDAKGMVFSGYWPIKGEADLRPLMTDLHASGVRIVLPIVETRFAPLVFRRWTPETQMVRGDWNILVPPPEAEALRPDIVLPPVLGWDDAGFRLGYGGGYFDRTLAELSPCPFTIGVGLQAARLDTVYPQTHDIPLDVIITEQGLQFERS